MKVVLLAGGSGQRLWPLSRRAFPKQFLKLESQESLFRKTIKRNLALVSPHDLFVLTHQDYFHEVLKDSKEIPQSNILCEPVRKNTAGAIALAVKYLETINEEEIVLIVPSDHVMAPLEKYVECVQKAKVLAKDGFLVTFGIPPTRPETGYGYIKASEDNVEKFVEKPDYHKAQEYLLEGNYFWNSGMFAFSVKTMKEELEAYAPEIGSLFKKSYEEALAFFHGIPSISIDYAVMEKSKKVKMVPLNLSWSDVGSWTQVYDLFDKDTSGNAFHGKVEAIETTNSLVFSEKRLVSTLGIDNLLIIETEDALLVADKEKGQQVKELVDKLKCQGKKEVEEHLFVNRPWGSYTVLQEGERYKIKKIEVKPLQKLSLQLHYHRSEHWIVVKGTAKVTIDENEKIVREGESIFVPKTSVHRVENPGKVSLEIIEVQVGEYLGEDDIIRLEDVYGRLKKIEQFSETFVK